MLGDLARRGLPDIAEALDPAQRLVEIFDAVRHAHQPGMDRQAEHLAAGVIPMASDEAEAPVYRVMDAAGLTLR